MPQVNTLRARLHEFDPPSQLLDSLPLEKLQLMIENMDSNVRRMRLRKERVAEQASKCCICWAWRRGTVLTLHEQGAC